MRCLPTLAAVLLACPVWVGAAPTRDDFDRAPLHTLSPTLVKAQIGARKDEPLRFAVETPVMAEADDGAWDEPEPGLSRWRLRVRSEQAQSLSFRIDELQLPAGASLWLYDRDAHDLQGPLAIPAQLPLWTPLVRGSETMLEVRMPTADRAQFAIRVAQAFHGYRSLGARSFAYDPVSDSGNGASGACNIDVVCPAGDGWRDQIRSTVLLTIGGSSLCSGTLVNNSRQDDRALVLTANHCGITDANVGSTIAYFNVQRSACGSGSFGSVSQNLGGRSLLTRAAAGTDTDFALIELASKPPQAFNVHYAGLDPAGAVPTSGVGIHHPAADDKKISRYTSPASAESNVCIGSSCGLLPRTGFQIDAWAVVWSSGTTEGGSSGSALWNQSRLLVGTLSGGSSQCTSASSNNGGVDYYARLDTAWTLPGAGGKPSLKAVLDPVDSGCSQISGKNRGTASALNCRSGGTPPPVDTGGGGGGGGSPGALVLLGVLLAIRRRQG